MDMTGEYRIPAPRTAVWDALNDPAVLKACIPGCESLERVGDEMVATVVAKIGPVKAKFAGKVRIENPDPPNGYSIVGEGQGGVAGFAKGGADVKLAEDGGETVLTYTAKAQVGGKLAQLGSRLIDGTAKMMAEQFFSAFSEKVGAAAGTPAGPAELHEAEAVLEPEGGTVEAKEAALDHVVHAVEAAEAKVEEAAAKAGPSGPMVWALVALAVVVLIILVSQF
jgi:carbon monoxide dehydrogenase subunit G